MVAPRSIVASRPSRTRRGSSAALVKLSAQYSFPHPKKSASTTSGSPAMMAAAPAWSQTDQGAAQDAAEALDYLRDLGFRMVTLTNSPPSDGPSALDRAGLGGYFERSFSVAPTGRFKPAPQTYRLVADALAVTPRDLCLVACHVWDTMGLQAMGGKGALVTHGVNAPLPGRSVPQPDLVAADLSSLARRIAEAWPG